MPLSRPVLIALVGAVLALAAFLATSASRQEASSSDSSAAELAARAKKASGSEDPAPAKPKKQKSEAVAAKPTTTKVKADAKPAKPAAKVEGVPPSVKRALDKKRTLVLFFRQSGSADDAAVAAAVNTQRGRRGVSVFTDNIRRLARYRAVVGALGISQAPAVVIVGRSGEARVVEGFVDEGSLTQQVVDSK